MQPQRVAGPQGAVQYQANWLPATDCNVLLAELASIDSSTWRRQRGGYYRIALSDSPGTLSLNGGAEYTPSRAWTPQLLDVRDRLQRETGKRYNFALVNRYRPEDYMPGHSDNASNSDEHIASLSVGAARPFNVFPGRTNSGVSERYMLGNGDLLRTNGHRRYHDAPSHLEAKGVRFNVTFRQVFARLPSVTPNVLQQYFSEHSTAARFARYVLEHVPNYKSLCLVDVCAGDGALAAALPGFKSTTTIEVDARMEQRLRDRLPGASVVVGDATKVRSSDLPGTVDTRLVVMNPPFQHSVCGKMVAAALRMADAVVVLAPVRSYEKWTLPFGTGLVHQSEALRLQFTNLSKTHQAQFRVYRRYTQWLGPAEVASGDRTDVVINKVQRTAHCDVEAVAASIERVAKGYHTPTVPTPGSNNPPVKKISRSHHTWYCFRAGAGMTASWLAKLVTDAAKKIPLPGVDSAHNFDGAMGVALLGQHITEAHCNKID